MAQHAPAKRHELVWSDRDPRRETWAFRLCPTFLQRASTSWMYLILVVLQGVTCTGIIYGFPTLQTILAAEGVFLDACPEEPGVEPGAVLCDERALAFNRVFAVGAIAAYVGPLATGYVLDHKGVRFLGLFTVPLMALAMLLIGIAVNSPSRQEASGTTELLLSLSTGLMGALATSFMIPLFSVVNLFTKGQNVIIATLNGTFDLSAIIFPFLKLFWVAGFSLSAIVLSYGAVVYICFSGLLHLVLWPSSPFQPLLVASLMQHKHEFDDLEGAVGNTPQRATPPLGASKRLQALQEESQPRPTSASSATSLVEPDSARGDRTGVLVNTPRSEGGVSRQNTPTAEALVGASAAGSARFRQPFTAWSNSPRDGVLGTTPTGAGKRATPTELAYKDGSADAVAPVAAAGDATSAVVAGGQTAAAGEKAAAAPHSTRPNVWAQLKDPLFLMFVFYQSFNLLRFVYYLGTVAPHLESLEAGGADKYLPYLGILLACGSVTAFATGTIVDKFGLRAGFFCLCGIAVLFSLFALLPVIQLQPVTFYLTEAMRAFIFPLTASLITELYGFDNSGILIGVVTCFGGLVSLSQYPLINLTLKTFGGDFFPVNLAFLIISVLQFAFPVFAITPARMKAARDAGRPRHAIRKAKKVLQAMSKLQLSGAMLSRLRSVGTVIDSVVDVGDDAPAPAAAAEAPASAPPPMLVAEEEAEQKLTTVTEVTTVEYVQGGLRDD